MLFTLFVITLSIILSGLGAFVLARNRKLTENFYFGLFSITTAIWMTANYVGANFKSHAYARIFIMIDFLLGVWLAYFFWRFSVAITEQVRSFKVNKFLVLIFPVVCLFTNAMSLGGLFVKLPLDKTGAVEIHYGSLYFLYSTVLGILLVSGLIDLLLSKGRARGRQKSQITTILLGLVVAIVFVATANLVIPQLTRSTQINLIAGNSAYLGIVFFGALSAYAIVKHKLFDVRLVVARTLAYLTTIVALGAIYGLVALLLVNKLIFKQAAVTTYQQFIYVALAVVLAFIFQPIKKFFDKFSNRFFYRDAYDLKAAIDGFSSVLVANIDLNVVLKSAQELLGTTIKPLYSHYFLLNEGRAPYEFDTRGKEAEISKEIAELGRKIKRSIIVQDELTDADSNLREIMIQNEVSVIQKLETHTGLVGFAYLGAKKSGGIYNSQDVALLTIMGNELALAVQNALRFEEISQFNITLQGKVDAATTELQQTNEKLRQLDQAKDDFISMASHQLRTPLTSMKGYVSMVLDGDVGKVSRPQKEMLEQAFVSSQRMVYLISDLLNVSRLRTGKFVIENTESNLANVVEEEIHQLDETAVAKDLKLVYAKPKRFPPVPFDETKIRQVVMNFADNAVYYTPKGGTITIDVKETPKTIEYTCSDNGIGVSKEAQKSLFTKFFRADNAKKARPDGTGLGLYMARKVIVAQGGSLIFHSEEGKGSTFGFSLPKNLSDRPKAPVDDDDDSTPVASILKIDDKVAEAAGTKDSSPTLSADSVAKHSAASEPVAVPASAAAKPAQKQTKASTNATKKK